MVGIEQALLGACAEHCPLHGGELVSRAVAGNTVYSRETGWVVEVTADTVYLRRHGEAEILAPLSLFSEVVQGDPSDMPTEADLTATTAREEALEQVRRAAAVDAEFDHIFNAFLDEYLDAPEIVLAAE